jgi:hypothetical protein
MAIVIGDTTITGITAGGLPLGIITEPEIGYPGAVVQVVQKQTRTQASYSAPVSGNGTEMALLTTTITPKKAGNVVICEFTVSGEWHWDTVLVLTRNNVPLPDSTNSSGATGNRWSGIGTNQYESNGDQSSTPTTVTIVFVDKSSLSTASTYRIHVRASGATARTAYLNRTVTSAGADSYEAGVSSCVLTEIHR